MTSNFLSLLRHCFSCCSCPFTVPKHSEEVRQFLHECRQYLVKLNLFPSFPPSTDEHELKNQRVSTRVFIFGLLLSVLILLLFTSAVAVTTMVIIKTPTLDQYSLLYSKYSQTLTCPCTQISINYNTFLQVNYTLHNVCSSGFITRLWSDYLMTSYSRDTSVFGDFRLTGSFSFQALSAFCELVNDTLSDSLARFYSNQHFSISVTPLELFQSQTQALVRLLMSTTTNSFSSSLKMIRDTTQANGLLSALYTNQYIYLPPGASFPGTYPRQYSGCECVSSYACVAPSTVSSAVVDPPPFVVPGMFTGCFVIEALLQSNLECFYSETCFNQLLSRLPSVLSFNVTVLNASSRSRFSTNSTIKALLDELMVEDWYTNITYANYYAGCQPIECTYTHETRNGAVSIVTTLIGLIGGLVTALKLICPRLVKFVQWKKTRSNPEIGKMLLHYQ